MMLEDFSPKSADSPLFSYGGLLVPCHVDNTNLTNTVKPDSFEGKDEACVIMTG